jgi:hypothetical protein
LIAPVGLNPRLAFLISTALGGLGFIYPSFYLDDKKKDRIKLIEKKWLISLI